MVLVGVCPARAGMIRQCWGCPVLGVGLPRTRGDDPVAGHGVQMDKLFAPHARG